MRLISVETTPNPNSMKLNLDEQLGSARTYTSTSQEGCPTFVAALLAVPGVQSIFVCQDFVTLNKDPRMDWRLIIERATSVLSGATTTQTSVETQRKSAEKEGQVQVHVQTFRGVPIQVKVTDAEGETRVSLGVRFNESAQSIQAQTGADYLAERYWADYGQRYGTREEIAAELAEEIEGTFDQNMMERVKAKALGQQTAAPVSIDVLSALLQHEDWHRRLTAVQELSGEDDALLLLCVALKDAHPQVRRLAAAALGATGSSAAVEPLCQALLKDTAVGVRRTAGDALSDIGDSAAQPAMCQALRDQNKLVRWRAARFLSEVGTAEALPYLNEAVGDSEFEVRLEIESAIQRITGGSDGIGPAWKRITEQ